MRMGFIPLSHQPRSHYVLNGLKLCANGVDVVAMCYDLLMNFVDGLGREGAPEHYLRHNLAKVISSSPTTARLRCFKNGQGRFENYFGVTEPLGN